MSVGSILETHPVWVSTHKRSYGTVPAIACAARARKARQSLRERDESIAHCYSVSADIFYKSPDGIHIRVSPSTTYVRSSSGPSSE